MKVVFKILKYLGYAIGGVVGLVVILLVAVNFLLQIDAFTGFVLGKILPGVSESLGADIQVKKLRLSLVPTSIYIEGAHFTPAKGTYKRKFVSLDRLYLDVSTLQLASGRLVVEKLEIKGLQSYLLFQNGLANLPSSGKVPEPKEEKKEDSGPLELKYPVVIEDLKIKDSSFYMDMPDSNLELGIRDIYLGLVGSLEDGLAELEILFQDGYADMGEMHEQLTSLSIEGKTNLHEWTAEIEKLVLRIPGIELDAHATATNLLEELAAKVGLTLTVDAGKVNSFVKQPALAGGIRLEAVADLGLPKSGMTYAVTGNLALDQVRVNNLPVDLHTQIIADPQIAEIKNLNGSIGTGAINLWAKLGMKGGMPLDAKIALTGLDVGDAAARYGVSLPLTGVLDTDLTATGKLAKATGAKTKEGKPTTELAMAAKGNLVLSNFALGQGDKRVVAIPKIGVNLDAAYAGTVATLHHVIVTTAKNTIEVKGSYNTKGPMDIKAIMALDDLAEFSPITGKPIGGQGKLTALATGTASDPNVQSQLQFTNLLFDAYAVDMISGTLRLKGKQARVDALNIRTGESWIKGTAEVDLGKPMKLNANLQIPNGKVEDFLVLAGQKKLDVGGKIDLNVDIQGPVKNLTGDVTLNLNDVLAFGEKVKGLKLDAKMQDGIVVLNELRIAKKVPPRIDLKARKDKQRKEVPEDQWLEAVIAAQGRFDPATGEVELKLRTKNLNETASENLRKKTIPLRADLAISADVSGTLKDPDVKAKIEIAQARYGDYILGDTIINATVADQKARVKGELLANRWIERTIPSEEGWVIIHHTEPPATPVLIDEKDQAEDFTKSVDTDTVMEKTGQFGSIDLDLTADITGAKQVSGGLVFDQFDFSGFLGFLRDDERKSKTKKKKKKKDASQSVIKGHLNGRVDLEGTLKETAQMLVKVNMDELVFQKNQFILKNVDAAGRIAPIQIQLRGSDVQVDRFVLGGTGVDLTVDQAQVMGRDGYLLKGKVDLGVVKEFTSMLSESDGQLLLMATVPKDLKLNDAGARIDLIDGQFDVQNSPTALENFNLLVTLDNGVATIDKMSGQLGGGTLGGEGKMILDLSGSEKPKPPDINMVLKLRNIKTGFDPYLEASIEKVDLIISDRRAGGMEISGEVVIDKAVYSQDIDFLSILKSFQQPKKITGSATFEEKKENLFFNIGIRADDQVAFQNNFADIETKVDLLFTGSNAAPALLGNVEIVKGKAEVLKNNYKVSRGVITFLDEDRIFPNFDINVETPVKATTVYVVVSGNPDRYKISFSSDPPMPERDIVTLLALGVSYEEFQAGSSGIGGDEAAALAAQQLIGSQIKGLTGDTGFDISVESTAGQPRIKVKKEVEKDLYLSLYRGLAEPTLGA